MRTVVYSAAAALLLLLPSILAAQDEVMNRSVVTANFAYGFYTPNDYVKLTWSPTNWTGNTYTIGDGTFGGMCMNVRALFVTQLLDSRLSLGGEYGLHTLASQDNGGRVEYSYAGVPLGSESTKDLLLAHSIQAVADFLLAQLNAVDFHFGVGAGIVLFSGEKTQVSMTVPSPYGGTTIFQASTGEKVMDMELSGSLRLLAAIPVAMNTTLDPELRYFKSFGDQKVSVFQIAVGVSYEW